MTKKEYNKLVKKQKELTKKINDYNDAKYKKELNKYAGTYWKQKQTYWNDRTYYKYYCIYKMPDGEIGSISFSCEPVQVKLEIEQLNGFKPWDGLEEITEQEFSEAWNNESYMNFLAFGITLNKVREDNE